MTTDEPQLPATPDIYTEWPKVPPGPRPPDHYELLGLPRFETDVGIIHAAVLRCSSIVKKYVLTPEPTRRIRVQDLLNEIGRAGVVLEDPNQRAAYNCNFPDWVSPVPVTKPSAPPLPEPPRIPPVLPPPTPVPQPAPIPSAVSSPPTATTLPPARLSSNWKRIVGLGLAGIGVMILAVTIRNVISSRPSAPPPLTVTNATTIHINTPVVVSDNKLSIKGASGAGVSPSRPPAAQIYTNSLGMIFVPVNGTSVQFSIWDTRVQDYQSFVSATGRQWPKPTGIQGPTHPAIYVSWEDAKAFCEWLTKLEQSAGRLSAAQSYRLPTDAEWSIAAGLGDESGNSPAEKSGKITNVYPWGKQWPPPRGAGNYDSSLRVDDYAKTSPVGSFPANPFGLYDMGGNVWQPCEDEYRPGSGSRVLRGASWGDASPDVLLSSWRTDGHIDPRYDGIGFRCVLAGGIPAPAQVAATVAPPVKPANAANLPTNLTINLGNGVTIEFVLIQPGSFMMGSDKWGHEMPIHKVTITKPFYMGKYEVTQEQWQQIMGSNPSKFNGPKNPVEMVSWEDCRNFVVKLKALVSSHRFRLPTEAEWEYACRAGSTREYCFGDNASDLRDYAWTLANAGSSSHPVGAKKPNEWGLYDMHGNVWEWCADWYAGGYTAGALIDPLGASCGTSRALRGGSWGIGAPHLRSARRANYSPGDRYNNCGVRVVGEVGTP